MGTPINTSATPQPQTTTHRLNLHAWDSTRQCNGCGGHRIADDHETASLVCIDCGLVAGENMLEETPRYQGYGLTRVTVIGREVSRRNTTLRDRRLRSAMGEDSLKSLSNTQAATKERYIYTRRFMQRVEEARGLITSAGRANGVSDVVVKRAIFFFLLIKRKMGGRINNLKALACLYIAAREAGKNLRIVDLATQSGMSPYTLGTDYKKVRSFLVQRKTIDTATGLYVAEVDPWTELERIMTIGNSESIERGDYADLSQDLRDVLGISMEPAERSKRLRGLLSMSQKFMIIAADASLDNSRRIQSLVAACFIVALEVRLQLTESPKEMLQWVGYMYTSLPATVKTRYRELRKCILEWARRLPYVEDSTRVTDKKLVYYMEDVIKFFGHLQDKNRQLWAQLDKAAEEDECEDDVGHTEESGEDDGDYAQDGDASDEELGDQGVGDDNFNYKQDEGSAGDGLSFERDYVNDVPLSSKDILASMPARRHDPPAYIAQVKRRQRLGELIQAAKESISDPRTPSPHLGQKDSRLFEWVKRLLALGTTTEDEILEASDNCLADWVASGEARQAKPMITRSQEDLNSTELTEKDLDDDELRSYLRSEPDKEAVQRVMSRVYLEAEQISRMVKVRRDADETSRQVRLKRKRAREGLEAGQGGQTEGVVRERSRKLRLEALSDSDNELDAVRKAMPRPGQRIIHPVQEPSTENNDVEGEEEGEEAFDDVGADADALARYGGDDYDDAYEYDYEYD
ncbi:transcription factor TFIIIB subunit brf1 [Linnemannia gamsii]|uniref:Transcription factor TFIIIB subunit brf1 n=1 Tax=Linnemannia gamsii TaxID=64522 RepID=A0A9P6QU11_9FUNG|nr:transcription factor TFIIIB subunit brf1 [Linnemannia gamsii]